MLPAMRKSNLIVGLCTVSFSLAIQASTIITLPLNTPVFVSLTADPIVTVGTRTIDFTPNLNQQFIGFIFVATDVSGLYGGTPTYRETLGLRARDGLASLSGAFPLSPDPVFANALPVFTAGTTDLILFDLIVPGFGTLFTVTQTDLTGATTQPGQFQTPTPEPGAIYLCGAGLLALIANAIRIRRSTLADG
jgi:hypothetical protein